MKLGRWTRGILSCTVPPYFSGVEGCGICPTIWERRPIAEGGEMTVFPFVSMEGGTTHAKQLLIMDVCSFSFLGWSYMPNTYKRKTNLASWTQENLQSAHVISFVINMKYEKLRYLKWILLLWITNTHFSQAISPTHSASLYLHQEGRRKRRGGLKIA
jgi:hypothetical protein